MKNSEPEEVGPAVVQGLGDSSTNRANLWNADSDSVRGPISIFDQLNKIEKLLPDYLKPWVRFLAPVKNRILVSALFVVTGVVFVIGITLQIAVFPKLEGDSTVIHNLKAIHFFSSLVFIGISWLFIEWISRIITFPLLQLTKRADQISREAGDRLSVASQSARGACTEKIALEDDSEPFDEIAKLTRSFDRMLFHFKTSEARLRESEEKYRFLFDNAPSPIFVIDAENMMIFDVNSRAEEEYLYSKDEFLQMSFTDLGRVRDREETSIRLKNFFATEGAFFPVLQHRRKDRSLFMVNFQARTSHYQNRPAIIAAVWDVTERLEKRAKLIQASKMATLGEMATGVAHELNQPLHVIKLGSDYLFKKIRTGKDVTIEDLKQVTTEINASVHRASQIINHLRQFGRKADETMSPVDINTPILNAFNLIGKQLEALDIHWETNLDYNVPTIMGDLNRLEQVFINLILNARDAMLSQQGNSGGTSESGTRALTVRSFVEHERVVVTVSDTGPGVPDSLVSKIFDPFFTTKKVGEGTGLGLSITYTIVKDHQGTIEVDPPTGEGATFRLTFPYCSMETKNNENSSRRR